MLREENRNLKSAQQDHVSRQSNDLLGINPNSSMGSIPQPPMTPQSSVSRTNPFNNPPDIELISLERSKT